MSVVRIGEDRLLRWWSCSGFEFVVVMESSLFGYRVLDRFFRMLVASNIRTRRVRG